MFQNSSEGSKDEYFRSYADMSIHLEMIHDDVRTKTYRYAILKNYRHFYKKVILDVGAGTGILSMFCVQAGAKTVYAVEASDMALEAERVIKDNKMEDKIKVIRGRIEDVELPEKVDVIVSEWMGYFLFYESMLPSVILARDRFLKKNGLMFPSVARLYLAGISDEDVVMDGSDVWTEVKSSYELDMTSLKSKSLASFVDKVHTVPVDPTLVVTFPDLVCEVDLAAVSLCSLEEKFCESSFKLTSFGRSTINGFCSYFDVHFHGDIVLSTSPYKKLTHWNQCITYLTRDVDVEQDDVINGKILIRRAAHDRRGLEIQLEHSRLRASRSNHEISKGGDDDDDVSSSKQIFTMDRYV